MAPTAAFPAAAAPNSAASAARAPPSNANSLACTPAAAPGQADTSFKTTLLAEPHSNALILRAANPARLVQVRALVEKLDQPPAPGSSAASGNIHVVYLKNADATKLAATLRAALSAGTGNAQASAGSSVAPASSTSTGGLSAMGSGTTSGSSSAAAGSGLGAGASSSSTSSNQPSTGGQIQADPTTNSLIITAPEPQYRQLRTVIDKLDGRRAQVLVESLIVEVNANKLTEFGIQWQSVMGKQGSAPASG